MNCRAVTDRTEKGPLLRWGSLPMAAWLEVIPSSGQLDPLGTEHPPQRRSLRSSLSVVTRPSLHAADISSGAREGEQDEVER